MLDKGMKPSFAVIVDDPHFVEPLRRYFFSLAAASDYAERMKNMRYPIVEVLHLG